MTEPDTGKLADPLAIVKGAAVNLFGMLARTSRIFFTLFVTRVGGATTFGLFTLAAAVIEVVTRATIFGMDKSLLKFIPEHDETDPSAPYRVLSAAFRTAQVLGVVATIVLVWLAPWVAERWFQKPELGLPLRLIALSILPLTALSLVLAATKALKIMSYDALVTGIVFPLLLLLFAAPIIWMDDATAVLSLAYTAAAVIALVVAVHLFRRHFSVSRALFTPAGGAMPRLIRFSTPLGLHDFVQYLTIKLELLILGFFVSPVELGIYAVTVELAFVIRKFRQIFDPILIPVMAEAQQRRQFRRVQANLARVIRWVCTLGVLYVGAMVLFAEPILGVFGEVFAGGAVALIVLCLAHLINATTGLLDMAMMVSGRPRINLLNVCIVLVMQTALNLWLVPRYGMVGAAVAALVSFTVIGAVRLGQSLFILRLNPFTWRQLKPFGAGAFAAATILALRRGILLGEGQFLWVGLIAIFVLVYVLALRLLGIEDEDRRVLGELMK